jgi:ferredoxin-type protein NapH
MSKTKILRIVMASLAILLIARGVIVGEFGYGGLCSFNFKEIWATCPLGFLERSLAGRQLMPEWRSVVLVVLAVILLGRVFCAWICPTVVLRRVFEGKAALTPKGDTAPKGRNWGTYAPYAVLGGAVLASFVFRFPVFCFFCPIGLFWGFLFAVVRLASPHSLTPELVLFPIMLVVELWVLKSWCRSICPVGALLSIAGNLNRILLPAVRKDKCLAAKDINCRVCERVCPEGIELAKIRSSYLPNSCTKCLECYVKCPAKAIELPFLRLR